MLDQQNKRKKDYSVMLDLSTESSPRREPFFNAGNLTRKSCNRNCPL